jgi:hypothetical protein
MNFHQTSQLPENDRLSVSLKEYLAEIDVCMGGRVAEELSKWNNIFFMAPLRPGTELYSFLESMALRTSPVALAPT